MVIMSMLEKESEIPEVEPGRLARLAAIEREIARLTPNQLWDRRVLDDLFARVSQTEKHDLGPAFLKIEFDTILEQLRRKNIAGAGEERLARKFDDSGLFFNPKSKYDPEDSKVYSLLDEFDSVSADVRFNRNLHGPELAKLQNKKVEIRTQLKVLGVRNGERELLERRLADFYYANAASKMEGVIQNRSESGDEAKGSSTSFLHPLPAYLANESVQNTWTTKVLLYCLLEAIARPHLRVKWHSGIFYLEPFQGSGGSLLLYILLGSGVLLDRLLAQYVASRWLPFRVLPLGWSVYRLYLSRKRDRINRAIDNLKSHFSRFNDTFLCDGEELILKLRLIERDGVYIPSLVFSLLRLAKPKAGEY